MPEVRAPQGGVAQGVVLRVVVGHDEHVRSGRQRVEHHLGQRRMVHLDPGDGVGQPRHRRGVELLLARVDEVEVEVVPAEDAGQLVTDVAHAEDGDAGRDGQGLEEDADLAAAALPPVLGARLVAEGDGRAAPVRSRPPRASAAPG